MVVAIAGAAVAAVFVYGVGSLGRGGATPLKLALAGAAISAAFTSLTSAVLLPRVDAMETFRFWQIGGVGGATWDRIAMVLPVLAVGAVICLLCARGMNSLALGDDLAAGLGENVFRTRLIAAAGAVILCGAATAVAGPIAFVGLVIPHLCRLLVGTDHRWLLPFCAAGGGRRCSWPPTSSGASSRVRRRSRSASSPPSSAHRSSSGSSVARRCVNCERRRPSSPALGVRRRHRGIACWPCSAS